jgi:hypothetical protein
MKTKKKLTADQLHDLYFRGRYRSNEGMAGEDWTTFSGWWFRIIFRIACDEVSELDPDEVGNRVIGRIEEAAEEWEQVVLDQIQPRSKRMIRQGTWYNLF